MTRPQVTLCGWRKAEIQELIKHSTIIFTVPLHKYLPFHLHTVYVYLFTYTRYMCTFLPTHSIYVPFHLHTVYIYRSSAHSIYVPFHLHTVPVYLFTYTQYLCTFSPIHSICVPFHLHTVPLYLFTYTQYLCTFSPTHGIYLPFLCTQYLCIPLYPPPLAPSPPPPTYSVLFSSATT